MEERFRSKFTSDLSMLLKPLCQNGDLRLHLFLCVQQSSKTAGLQIFTQRSGHICLIIIDMTHSTLDLHHSEGSEGGHVLQHHINRC